MCVCSYIHVNVHVCKLVVDAGIVYSVSTCILPSSISV